MSRLLPGFGGGVAQPPPVAEPTLVEDPAVKQARKDTRLAELRRKGRKATILTAYDSENSNADVTRPAANNSTNNNKKDTLG